MDLYSVEDYLLEPGQRKLISTGLKIEVPRNYEIQIRPKSGLALKYGITVLNTQYYENENYHCGFYYEFSFFIAPLWGD